MVLNILLLVFFRKEVGKTDNENYGGKQSQNFFMNTILISYFCCHIPERITSNQKIMNLPCILVLRHNHVLSLLCVYF
jgi:hypothetical protein